MPLSYLDSTTWSPSTLYTPVGPISYWVMADWDEYYEQYATDNTLTKVQIAVNWVDVLDFKWYALGFAEGTYDFELSTGEGADPYPLAYLNRYTPLECPFQEKQYLVDLKKRKVLSGINTDGTAVYAENNPAIDNWPDFPASTSMQARVVYDATFSMLLYDVIPQDRFETIEDKRELRRFVIRSEKGNPRERKTPSFGFERDDTGTPIPEVGFIPYYDEAHVVTWVGVPWELVPRTAIRETYLTINDEPFEFANSGLYGKWNEGTVRFDGLAREITPYRNAAGQRVADLPYLFTHQPGDPSVDGGDVDTHWKVPIGTSWVKVRRRGTDGTSDTHRMYLKRDFERLFQPEFV